MIKSTSITLAFVLICAMIWFTVAVIVATGLHSALPDSQVYRWTLAGFSFLSAVILIILFLLLRSRNKVGYFLTVCFLFFIAMFTIMDDLGIVDFVVLLITLTPIVLLIKDRTRYLQNSSPI